MRKNFWETPDVCLLSGKLLLTVISVGWVFYEIWPKFDALQFFTYYETKFYLEVKIQKLLVEMIKMKVRMWHIRSAYHSSDKYNLKKKQLYVEIFTFEVLEAEDVISKEVRQKPLHINRREYFYYLEKNLIRCWCNSDV